MDAAITWLDVMNVVAVVMLLSVTVGLLAFARKLPELVRCDGGAPVIFFIGATAATAIMWSIFLS